MKNILNNSWFRLALFIICGLFLLILLSANYKGSNETKTEKPDENTVIVASLVNTYWKLIDLQGQPVITAEGQREMKLTLNEENKVNGFGGCNAFFGSYTHDVNTIKFGQLAASRMFCADTMDQENQFLKTLADTEAYKIIGGDTASL